MNDRDADMISGYLHGRLSETELTEFRTRLHAEPTLVDALVERSIDEARIIDWAAAQTAQRPDDIDFAPPAIKHRMFAARPRVRRGLLSLAAVVSILIACGIWWINRPSAIAQITEVGSATGVSHWLDWRTIRVGQTLQLASGVLEIETQRGVQVTLEGPCSCRFDSAQLVHLLNGRIYADVPDAGRGFTVSTPSGTIIDWGTRFGIDVESSTSTEVHVFAGRVTLETARGDNLVDFDVRAGQAVLAVSTTPQIKRIPLSHKFATGATQYVEHFDYPRGALATRGGWIDYDLHEQHVGIEEQGLLHAPLVSGSGGALSVNTVHRATSPIFRRWHHRFFSAIVKFDDDFAKRMTRDHQVATLLAFSSDDLLATPRLRVLTNAHGRDSLLTFGIGAEELEFGEREHPHQSTHFLVVELADDVVRLWIDPSSDTFAARRPPEPDAVVPRTDTFQHGSFQPQWLWIGDADNPGYAWFRIDEIRGGNSWAEVTPTR